MNVHDLNGSAGCSKRVVCPAPSDGDPRPHRVQHARGARENADNRPVMATLAIRRLLKVANPDLQIAVGGCLAQKDRSTIADKAPWVDVVFGTYNLGALPDLLERACVRNEAQVEIL